jgi:hypothetical protein
MKNKILVCVVAILMILSFTSLHFAFAQQKSISLPKRTTVEKLGAGHFEFKLPNGQIVEAKEFDPKTGAIGYVGIIEPDPLSKPVSSSKQGKLQGQVKSKPVKLPPGTEYVLIDDEVVWVKRGTEVPRSDYVMIDDEVVWLPATIQFQSEVKGLKELSPQPDPPGRLRK